MFIPDKDLDALYSALFALCPTQEAQQRLAEINKDRDNPTFMRSQIVLRMMAHTIFAMEDAR